MNALVASVIRTYTPIIVGQLAAWLIMIHVPVLPELEVLFTAIVGGLLSAAYYTLVRVLEQQWPGFGILLGLTASPDTYSKGNDSAAEAAKQTSLASTAINAPDPATSVLTAEAPAATFPKAAVDAALAAEPVAPVEPVTVTPVFTPPTS